VDGSLHSGNFKFNTMKAGGGKGGDPMAMTNDHKFFVKEVTGDDQEALEQCVHSTHARTMYGLIRPFVRRRRRLDHARNALPAPRNAEMGLLVSCELQQLN
jgi:hypothetical protein